MSEAATDPYVLLGVAPDISDLELRRVYRDLVKRHHPDRNGGSAESAARFAQIQNAYALIVQARRGPQPAGDPPIAEPAGSAGRASDPGIEDRIANLERELAAMRAAEQRRAQAAEQRRAQAPEPPAHRLRSTPEELGYYTTDDSFTQIVDDAAEQFARRLRQADAKKQFARRLSELFGRDSR